MLNGVARATSASSISPEVFERILKSIWKKSGERPWIGTFARLMCSEVQTSIASITMLFHIRKALGATSRSEEELTCLQASPSVAAWTQWLWRVCAVNFGEIMNFQRNVKLLLSTMACAVTVPKKLSKWQCNYNECVGHGLILTIGIF